MSQGQLRAKDGMSLMHMAADSKSVPVANFPKLGGCQKVGSWAREIE